MKVPKKIIYQVKLELERKKKKLLQVQHEIELLEKCISEMEPMYDNEHNTV